MKVKVKILLDQISSFCRSREDTLLYPSSHVLDGETEVQVSVRVYLFMVYSNVKFTILLPCYCCTGSGVAYATYFALGN